MVGLIYREQKKRCTGFGFVIQRFESESEVNRGTATFLDRHDMTVVLQRRFATVNLTANKCNSCNLTRLWCIGVCSHPSLLLRCQKSNATLYVQDMQIININEIILCRSDGIERARAPHWPGIPHLRIHTLACNGR